MISEPEEGPAFAFRLGYTYINTPAAFVRHTSVLAPELVTSKRLMFAEPYLGVGTRLIRGTLDIPFQVAYSPVTLPDVVRDGSAIDAYAFTGIYFRILGATGLRMGIEGSFDLSGYHTIGTVFGLGF